MNTKGTWNNLSLESALIISLVATIEKRQQNGNGGGKRKERKPETEKDDSCLNEEKKNKRTKPWPLTKESG